MGLDAVVFKNLNHLRPQLREAGVTGVDPLTGQAEFRAGVWAPLSDLVSADVRFGNLDEVVRLRESIEPLFCGRSSLLLEKVLSSGTHTGDVIPLSDLGRLRGEVDLVRSRVESPSVRSFLDSCDRLIASARDEANPIVFV